MYPAEPAQVPHLAAGGQVQRMHAAQPAYVRERAAAGQVKGMYRAEPGRVDEVHRMVQDQRMDMCEGAGGFERAQHG